MPTSTVPAVPNKSIPANTEAHHAPDAPTFTPVGGLRWADVGQFKFLPRYRSGKDKEPADVQDPKIGDSVETQDPVPEPVGSLQPEEQTPELHKEEPDKWESLDEESDIPQNVPPVYDSKPAGQQTDLYADNDSASSGLFLTPTAEHTASLSTAPPAVPVEQLEPTEISASPTTSTVASDLAAFTPPAMPALKSHSVKSDAISRSSGVNQNQNKPVLWRSVGIGIGITMGVLFVFLLCVFVYFRWNRRQRLKQSRRETSCYTSEYGLAHSRRGRPELSSNESYYGTADAHRMF